MSKGLPLPYQTIYYLIWFIFFNGGRANIGVYVAVWIVKKNNFHTGSNVALVKRKTSLGSWVTRYNHASKGGRHSSSLFFWSNVEMSSNGFKKKKKGLSKAFWRGEPGPVVNTRQREGKIIYNVWREGLATVLYALTIQHAMNSSARRAKTHISLNGCSSGRQRTSMGVSKMDICSSWQEPFG